jgi:hypothetical protein
MADQDRRRNLNPSPTTFNLLNEAVNNDDNLNKDYGASKFMRIDENTIKATRTEVIYDEGNEDVHIAYKAERYYNIPALENIPDGTKFEPTATVIRDMHLTEKNNDGSDGANDIHYGLGNDVTNEDIGNFSNRNGVRDQEGFDNLGKLVTSARDSSWYDQNHQELNEELEQQYQNLNNI